MLPSVALPPKSSVTRTSSVTSAVLRVAVTVTAVPAASLSTSTSSLRDSTTSGTVSLSVSVTSAPRIRTNGAVPATRIFSGPSKRLSSVGVSMTVADAERWFAGSVKVVAAGTTKSRPGMAASVPLPAGKRKLIGTSFENAVSLGSPSAAVTVKLCAPPFSLKLVGMTLSRITGESII